MIKKNFDKHLWKAEVCATQEELDDFFRAHQIGKKKIKAVHVIGMAQNMEKWRYEHTMRTVLTQAGIPVEDINNGQCAYIDMTHMPCKVRICEPVVFVFTDGSTFEVMPVRWEGLKLSVNQIGADVTEGTNHSNFDAMVLFGQLIGKSIKRVEKILRREVKRYGYVNWPSEDVSSDVTYMFMAENDFGLEKDSFYMQQSYESWFDFGLCAKDERGCAHTTYAKIQEAAQPVCQIPIVEGHDCSSYFWIMPVKRVEKMAEDDDLIEEYLEEEISIEEDDVSQFLYYFLEKYFDSDYPYDGIRDDEFCGKGFEWNLEYNIYTYDTMRLMLAEIESCAILLEQNYDAEELAKVKERFGQDGLTAEEIVDFYRRFVRRIRAMMEYAPEYELISFMGP